MNDLCKCWKCGAVLSFNYMGYSEEQVRNLIIKDQNQMTRDEAIEIELKHLSKLPANLEMVNKLAAANIDALIELGLLKVEEPEKASAFTIIRRLTNPKIAGSICTALIENGYSIVSDGYKNEKS